MRDLTRRSKKLLSIRELAQSITRSIASKDWRGEASAIQVFVRDKIRYVKDIRGVETLATPLVTLDTGSGDCDDKAVLAASLLESIGHPTRFVAIGFAPDTYQHVFAETLIGNHWVVIETTEAVDISWKPKGYVERMQVHN